MAHIGNVLSNLSLSPFSSASPFNPTYFMSCTVSNVICCLVFGQRLSYDDDHFLNLLQIISEVQRFGSSARGQVREEGAEKVRHDGDFSVSEQDPFLQMQSLCSILHELFKASV